MKPLPQRLLQIPSVAAAVAGVEGEYVHVQPCAVEAEHRPHEVRERVVPNVRRHVAQAQMAGAWQQQPHWQRLRLQAAGQSHGARRVRARHQQHVLRLEGIHEGVEGLDEQRQRPRSQLLPRGVYARKCRARLRCAAVACGCVVRARGLQWLCDARGQFIAAALHLRQRALDALERPRPLLPIARVLINVVEMLVEVDREMRF
jgi:hypothetical protein